MNDKTNKILAVLILIGILSLVGIYMDPDEVFKKSSAPEAQVEVAPTVNPQAEEPAVQTESVVMNNVFVATNGLSETDLALAKFNLSSESVIPILASARIKDPVQKVSVETK